MQINLVKIKSKMKLEQASALDSVDSMLKRNNLLQVIFWKMANSLVKALNTKKTLS